MQNISIRTAVQLLPGFAPTSKAERETVIVLCDAEPGIAHVWTAQPHRARQLLRDHPAALVERQTDTTGRLTGLTFTLPAACVRLRPKRILSDRQKAALQRAADASKSPVSGPKTPQQRAHSGVEPAAKGNAS